jgi:5,10-methylenetetrahydrofolate reductase
MILPAHFIRSPRPVMLYGTTPPREGASRADIQLAAEKLVDRTSSLELDGIVVYDVQDESERTQEPRPFPFLPTLDSRIYSKILHELSGIPVVTYKCVAQMSEESWGAWLDQSADDFGITALSLVGSPTQKRSGDAISLPKATEMAIAHPANFCLGAVAIAERHTETRSESQRMIQKAQAGCEFFVSQSVYNSQKTIKLVNDYARECRQLGIEPKRFIFTFAPCGRAKTMEFIKWLGVSVPPEIERGILEAANPLDKSVEICRSILLEILDGIEDKSLPLGLNIESVSINKEEIEASIKLFNELGQVLKVAAP